MTDLVVRRPLFEFDDTLQFNWKPDNPVFSLFCNLFTFFAVPFEKYVISTVRMAQDRLVDPAMAEEAEAFLQQEAQHSSAHRKHMLALVKKYPELEDVYQGALESYKQLLAENPLDFHVSYIANLEGTFTPLFKVILDNRESMLDSGDRRVSSLVAWHAVEEIEHRSSGMTLCHYLTPSRWTRTRYMPRTFKHLMDLSGYIAAEFDRIVPEADRVISAKDSLNWGDLLAGELVRRPNPLRRRRTGVPAFLHAVPLRQIRAMLWRLALTQAPYHDSRRQPLPELVDVWMREYERGADMTKFCGTPVATQ